MNGSTTGEPAKKFVGTGFPTSGAKKIWHDLGKVHRGDDLPAVIEICPTHEEKAWYMEDKRHRDGGKPAVVTVRQSHVHYEWWEHGKKLREERVDNSGDSAAKRQRLGDE